MIELDSYFLTYWQMVRLRFLPCVGDFFFAKYELHFNLSIGLVYLNRSFFKVL